MTLPVNIPFVDRAARIDYRWLNFLKSLEDQVEQIEVEIEEQSGDFVKDGSKASFGPMTLFQGADALKPATPEAGSIYFALDTNKIYGVVGGVWRLLDPELTGDVIKAAGSTLATLANVFPTPGTYGSATQTPVITVDAKGRITNLWFEDIGSGPAATPGGASGALQFNNTGSFGGTTISFNPVTGGLTFLNPAPTREALSPLTTKGDIFVRNSTVSTRLPVGTNGQFLRANSATATGLEWANDNTIEVRFNFGDASPKPIATVPANRVVRAAAVTIITPFDGVGATLSLGPAGDLLAVTDNNPYVAGTYANNPGLQYPVNTPVNLSIIPGTATTGSGLVTITLEE